MSKPLLSIFADGLRYDSLQYMPFVKSLNSVPLETILGYSITCHPSMYTGVYPNKHKIVFHWVKSKSKHGPYTPLSIFPNIFPFSNPYVQAVESYMYAKLFLKNNAFSGYGKLLNLPMKFWKYLEANELKYWDEDGYLGDRYKTIFEILRKERIKHYVSGMHKPNMGKLNYLKVVKPKYYDWIYYFIGETDSLSHKYTQHSNEGIAYLQTFDNFIKERYFEFEKSYGNGNFTFIFWSDHGHIPINKRYNLYDLFKNELNLKKEIFHIIDSTTVRFWTNSMKKRQKIIKIMNKLPEANLVDNEGYRKLHLPQEKNLYGDLFYYLDGGVIFTHTIHGFGLKTKSMHGYHPDAEGNLGVFVSNRTINHKKVNLPDVFASTISALGLQKYNQGINGYNKIS